MTLLEFIEQRLAEDEQWSLAASQPYRYAAEGATVPPGGVHWTWVVGENWTPVTPDPAVDDTVGGPDHYGCPVNLASVEEWRTQGSDHGWPVRMMRRTIANQMVEVDSSAAGHIVRHDPARVLREVAYKRRVVDKHQPRMLVDPNGKERPDWPERECRECGNSWMGTQTWEQGEDFVPPEPDYCDELIHLVAVYADHPDYNPSWSPS